MNVDRRRLLGSFAALAAAPSAAVAQQQTGGFAGLATSAAGFAEPERGRRFRFPHDHGAHPDFRIEWWYVTAALTGDDGRAYGAQWTLFRAAIRPPAAQGLAASGEAWASPHIFMAHAAVTTETEHRFAERFARGGVGQAGVRAAADGFEAWLDDWSLTAQPGYAVERLSPLSLRAATAEFLAALELEADLPIVAQGDAGYSVKSEAGQASHYLSQPYYAARGRLEVGAASVDVRGRAWLDREWSSAPLTEDQTGWDWFALHLDSGAAVGAKAMLYRLRDRRGADYLTGNWMSAAGESRLLARGDARLTPLDWSAAAGRRVPTRWRVEITSEGVDLEAVAVNPSCWMAVSVPYWEGPIRLSGSHEGVGYLEMTGY